MTHTKVSLNSNLKKKYQISFRRWLKGIGGGGTVKDFIGGDLFFVKQWIGARFLQGMTWDNYGKYWVVDHIVPLRLFDMQDKNDLMICWNYKNMMPLLKKDNLNKEGNVFFAFELLMEMKGKDFYYKKLLARVKPEVETMLVYIDKFSEPITIN